jgi:hypothetical protein
MKRLLTFVAALLFFTALSLGCSGDKDKGINADKDKPVPANK